MEEYLTTKELAARIRYSEQTIYNMIHKGTLILGEHYIKPTPKKLLFRWSAMRDWLGETPSLPAHINAQDQTRPEAFPESIVRSKGSGSHREKGSRVINI